MKIAIDATFNPSGGSLVHLEEFIKNIRLKYSKSDTILYLKKENHKIINKEVTDLCTLKYSLLSSYGNIFRIIWGQLMLPFVARKDNIDILFCPGNISPIIKTTEIKAQWIATIGPFSRDVYNNSNLFEKCQLLVNMILIYTSSKSSNVIIHESGYSRKLFEEVFKFDSKKQFLIECGKDDYFYPKKMINENIKKISRINSDDLLCVSHLYPYKNIELLIRALKKYKDKHNVCNKLYIAGKPIFPQYYKRLRELIRENELSDCIIFTGMLTKEELRFGYSNCKLFLFPSLAESSGYILIEAMSCGAAIIASSNTAIPWTCGECAEYFDPYNSDDLLTKLEECIVDDEKLTNMRARSIKRASEMINYSLATEIFLDIVEKCYRNHG